MSEDEARARQMVREMPPALRAIWLRAGEMLLAGVHRRIVTRWAEVQIARLG